MKLVRASRVLGLETLLPRPSLLCFKAQQSAHTPLLFEMAQTENEYEYEVHDDFLGTSPPDCAIVCRPATTWEAWAESPEPLQDSDKQRALVKVHRSRLLAVPLYNSTMVEGAFDTKDEVIIEGLPVIHVVPHAANDLCIILGIAYNDLSKIDQLDTLNRFQLWQLWQACNFYQMYVLRHSVSMLLRPSLSDTEAGQAIKIHCAARDLHDGKLAATAFEKLMQLSLPQLNDTGLLRHLDDAHLSSLITRQLREIVTEVDGVIQALSSSSYNTSSLAGAAAVATERLRKVAQRTRPT